MNGGTGASHLSRGGRARSSLAPMPRGDFYQRGLWGAGGGAAGSVKGGRGGGMILLKITGILKMEGAIRMNGLNGQVSELMSLQAQ